MLSHEEIKKFYDAFGKRQDRQFYERAALDRLMEYSLLTEASAVFELGCGTCKFAYRAFAEALPARAHYVGLDISTTMLDLCRERMRPFSDRVELKLTTGELPFDMANASVDRFIACYVLDLLPETEISAVIAEAHRILSSNGLICLAVLTKGINRHSRLVTAIWTTLFKIRPALVGGCRPISIGHYIDSARWKITHHETIVSAGIASEVLTARKR